MTDPIDQFEGHAPGPWRPTKLETGGRWVFAGTRRIAFVPRNFPYEEDEANVALIAESPSLLAEVKRLREENERLLEAGNRLADYAEGAPGTANLVKKWDIARAALTPVKPEEKK